MKRKKILLVLLMSLVMVFGSSVTALAADESAWYASKELVITSDGYEFDIPSLMKSSSADSYASLLADKNFTKYAIYSRVGTIYVCFYNKADIMYRYTESNGLRYCSRLKVDNGMYIVTISNYKSDPQVGCGFVTVTTSNNDSSSQSGTDNDLKETLKCSTDPIYANASGSVVFMNAPTPMRPGILYRRLDQQAMMGAIMEVKNLIPLGLTCLVGFLGLRKALQVLQGILHQA